MPPELKPAVSRTIMKNNRVWPWQQGRENQLQSRCRADPWYLWQSPDRWESHWEGFPKVNSPRTTRRRPDQRQCPKHPGLCYTFCKQEPAKCRLKDWNVITTEGQVLNEETHFLLLTLSNTWSIPEPALEVPVPGGSATCQPHQKHLSRFLKPPWDVSGGVISVYRWRDRGYDRFSVLPPVRMYKPHCFTPKCFFCYSTLPSSSSPLLFPSHPAPIPLS